LSQFTKFVLGDHKCFLSVTCYRSNYEIRVRVNILCWSFYHVHVVNLGAHANASTPKIEVCAVYFFLLF